MTLEYGAAPVGGIARDSLTSRKAILVKIRYGILKTR